MIGMSIKRISVLNLCHVLKPFVKSTPGIAVSKCVYLASMAVKIEHTVAGHNHDILQLCIFDVHASRIMGPQPEFKMQNICFCSSKLICIHGKLNKNKLCSIKCYISPLGNLPAISINVL